MMRTDTIFALASGGGRTAVAVIRVSGPQASSSLSRLTGMVPAPRRATVATLRDPRSGKPLDRALILWFPGPNSFTGEDCAEFQVHGGRAVVDAVLSALADLPDCRPAEPGEFTRRAFLNRKMDLAEVEGLADLIDAQTEAQRRQALRQLDGALGVWATREKARLLQAMAAAESAIDFSEEADVAGDFAAEVTRIAEGVSQSIAAQLAQSSTAARIRDGFVVTLAGPPNAGKSTLLNALARRDAAIVSPHAGTTRDPVEIELDLDGYLVICIDTAGLRDSDDPIEQEGMARARARAASADLVLWLSDSRDPVKPDGTLVTRTLWTVATKLDLSEQPVSGFDHSVAAPTGEGIDALTTAIRGVIAADGSSLGAGLVTRLRHRQALDRAQAALTRLLHDPESGMEIRAEQLRQVGQHLDSLMGRIEPEAVLGEIFARFCVGK
ncbi:tRNA uridine-5-carboxymethylaminomethyl(34) synthesis GTPase MnmE [Lichenihabitans psoromatis]|uniref:tRNA uridine-5-carboxymethylaminomethyl(34) synthesis GTPase MnmE n=1 Tax=Lichenihabitans psoromatis TaxID=2528642 RepID=UPI0010383498|nr:tRNA uridine-5-carboxymethylaminomethyl(34) synthesis GTPase MnmE [Lichenihabitans psoromatis]